MVTTRVSQYPLPWRLVRWGVNWRQRQKLVRNRKNPSMHLRKYIYNTSGGICSFIYRGDQGDNRVRMRGGASRGSLCYRWICGFWLEAAYDVKIRLRHSGRDWKSAARNPERIGSIIGYISKDLSRDLTGPQENCRSWKKRREWCWAVFHALNTVTVTAIMDWYRRPMARSVR